MSSRRVFVNLPSTDLESAVDVLTNSGFEFDLRLADEMQSGA